MIGCPDKGRFFGLLLLLKNLGFASSFLGLLGQEDSLDVWQYTTLSNGHTRQQFVQLLVVADGQLEMTWDNPGLLVVSGSVTGQLEYFSGQVFQHCSQVDWGSSTDSLGIVSFSQQTVDTSDWELESSP